LGVGTQLEIFFARILTFIRKATLVWVFENDCWFLIACLLQRRAQFLKWCSVSKETKASVCSFLATNSNSTRVKSVGLRVALSFKNDGGYPADGFSGNGNTLLPKSTSVRGEDHPVADPVLPMDSMMTPEILSANLALVMDKFSDDDTDTELDLDSPTEGFASIPDAIEDVRQGKVSTSLNVLMISITSILKKNSARE
jgi:3,4-dihydroxy 2-butanone 4-phosphate synthase / GTP cyclohydrolase II